jgi:uncharacterized protein YbbK (DUF523 family)
MTDNRDAGSRIKVGVSACLLGEPVRYDGQHKHLPLLTRDLARYFDFVPTCPEVGAGLGVPRRPVRLVGSAAAPRVVEVDDARRDHTARLAAYTASRLPELQDLCGYIFIRNSPSCGLFQVKVYRDDGDSGPDSGRGVFAAALTARWPLLPVEEDGRLEDPALRDSFVMRVFATKHWQDLCRRGLSAAGLLDLHARYQDSLMARAPEACAALARLLAAAGHHDLREVGARYFAGLLQALQQQVTWPSQIVPTAQLSSNPTPTTSA